MDSSMIGDLPPNSKFEKDTKKKPNSSGMRGINRGARIFIVDDHPIVRNGVRMVVAGIEGCEVCGEAESLGVALGEIQDLRPDVVVLDLVSGGRYGVDSLNELRRLMPATRILVFSMNPEELFAEASIRAGANGYLMKTAGIAELRTALGEVVAGRLYVSPSVCTAVSQRGDLLESLSDREHQVFLRMGEGKTTGEIAAELQLSTKTIATHRENIKAKLGIASGAELTRRAVVHVLSRGGFEAAA
jgi:DNA-binding NarL/FixJ family response regulator